MTEMTEKEDPELISSLSISKIIPICRVTIYENNLWSSRKDFP